MPGMLSELMARLRPTQISSASRPAVVPSGMGPGNAGYQPSPMEELAMQIGQHGQPEVMKGVMPILPGGGMSALMRATSDIGSGGSAVAPAATDVFKRGLANQSTRGSIIGSDELRALAAELFKRGTTGR